MEFYDLQSDPKRWVMFYSAPECAEPSSADAKPIKAIERGV